MPQISPTRVVCTATLFGRCLAAARAEAGLSQTTAARGLGISRPSLAHVETGRATLSFHVLLRLGQGPGTDLLDASAILTLLHMTARALQEEGVRVLNRPREKGETTLEQVKLDRVIGRVFDGAFRTRGDQPVARFDLEAAPQPDSSTPAEDAPPGSAKPGLVATTAPSPVTAAAAGETDPANTPTTPPSPDRPHTHPLPPPRPAQRPKLTKPSVAPATPPAPAAPRKQTKWDRLKVYVPLPGE